MRRNGLALALICLVGGVWWVAPDAAGRTAATENGEAPAVRGLYRGVSTAVKFDISPPLRSIPSGPIRAWKRTEREEAPTGLERAPGVEDFDPLVQSQLGVGEVPSPSVSFEATGDEALHEAITMARAIPSASVVTTAWSMVQSSPQSCRSETCTPSTWA